MAEPTLDRLNELAVEIGANEEEAWGTRTAVEVLVGATHGEVDLGLTKRNRGSSGRVAQIPQCQGTPGMGGGGDGLHVEHRSAPIRHVGEAHEPDLLVEFVSNGVGGRLGRHRAEAAPRPIGHSRQDVPVRREVARIGDDIGTLHCVERGVRQLVEVDRGLVGDENVADIGPDQWGKPISRLAQQRQPEIPTADETHAPCRLDGCHHRGHGPLGKPPERVAVEIHQAVIGDGEFTTKGAEGIGPIQCARRLEPHHDGGRRRDRARVGARRAAGNSSFTSAPDG